MTRVAKVFTAILLALCAASLALAQSSQASVNGTVRDQTGAVIPGAAVQLVNN
jgi:hypothetical protein